MLIYNHLPANVGQTIKTGHDVYHAIIIIILWVSAVTACFIRTINIERYSMSIILVFECGIRIAVSHRSRMKSIKLVAVVFCGKKIN